MNRRSFIKKLTMMFAGVFVLPTITAFARNSTDIVEVFKKEEPVLFTEEWDCGSDILADLRAMQEHVRKSSGISPNRYIIPKSLFKRAKEEGIL